MNYFLEFLLSVNLSPSRAPFFTYNRQTYNYNANSTTQTNESNSNQDQMTHIFLTEFCFLKFFCNFFRNWAEYYRDWIILCESNSLVVKVKNDALIAQMQIKKEKLRICFVSFLSPCVWICKVHIGK